LLGVEWLASEESLPLAWLVPQAWSRAAWQAWPQAPQRALFQELSQVLPEQAWLAEPQV